MLTTAAAFVTMVSPPVHPLLQKVTYRYNHGTVNHTIEFVTDDGVHTNTAECLWLLIKQRIAFMHDRPTEESLVSHLDEYCYRSFSLHGNVKENFAMFLRHVVQFGESPRVEPVNTSVDSDLGIAKGA
jgi:hypothetical protein